jgi:hypothetical protein
MLKRLILMVIFMFMMLWIPQLYAQIENTQDSQTTTETKQETAAPQKVTVEEVTKKQNDMMALVDQYNELINKAKEADSYGSKKGYMDQAKKLEDQMKEAQKAYADALKQYNTQLGEDQKTKNNPDAAKVYKDLKELEEKINKKATEHNDLLPKLQKAQEDNNATDVTNLTAQIESIRAEMKRLRSQYNDKLSDYKELTKEKPATNQ